MYYLYYISIYLYRDINTIPKTSSSIILYFYNNENDILKFLWVFCSVCVAFFLLLVRLEEYRVLWFFGKNIFVALTLCLVTYIYIHTYVYVHVAQKIHHHRIGLEIEYFRVWWVNEKRNWINFDWNALSGTGYLKKKINEKVYRGV